MTPPEQQTYSAVGLVRPGAADEALAFVSRVSAALSSSLDRTTTVRRFAEAAVHGFSGACAVHLIDDDDDIVLAALATASGAPGLQRATEAIFATMLGGPDGPIRESLRSRECVLIVRDEPPETDVAEHAVQLLDALRARSMMVAPVCFATRCVGVISFVEVSRPGPYGVADCDVAVIAARQLSIAIENLNSLQRERRITDRLRFLARATDQLFTNMEERPMLQSLVAALVMELSDWAAVASIVDGGLHVIAADSADPGIGKPATDGRILGHAEEDIVHAAQRRRPILINQKTRSRGPFRSILTSLDKTPRSWMSVPLLFGDRSEGTIVCYSNVRAYDEQDLGLLEEISRRTPLALEHAESFARERRLTQALQQATLPSRLASVPGAELSTVYTPAARVTQVGGDWYDAFYLSEGRILLTIGDVTGHGLEASIVMGKLRHSLNVVGMYEDDPAKIIDVAEEILARRYPGSIATAFAAIVDTNAQTITFSNAGHPCPIVRSINGETTQLVADGLPIGLRSSFGSAPSHQQSLSAADVLVFYTDGLTEATRDPLRGEARLRQVLRRRALPYVRSVAEFIYSACMPEPARDDVAILAINFTDCKRWSFGTHDRHAAKSARKDFIRELARNNGSVVDLQAAELAFGELVANAARHAPGNIDVALQPGTPPTLHMIDRGPGYEEPVALREVDAYEESGRGLWLIERLGGSVDIEFVPGYGTHVSVALA